jgi:hypothetical protein
MAENSGFVATANSVQGAQPQVGSQLPQGTGADPGDSGSTLKVILQMTFLLALIVVS